jgi:hypothetical protein
MLVGFPTLPHPEAEAAQSIGLAILGLPDRFVITDMTDRCFGSRC